MVAGSGLQARLAADLTATQHLLAALVRGLPLVQQKALGLAETEPVENVKPDLEIMVPAMMIPIIIHRSLRGSDWLRTISVLMRMNLHDWQKNKRPTMHS